MGARYWSPSRESSLCGFIAATFPFHCLGRAVPETFLQDQGLESMCMGPCRRGVGFYAGFCGVNWLHRAEGLAGPWPLLG